MEAAAGTAEEVENSQVIFRIPHGTIALPVLTPVRSNGFAARLTAAGPRPLANAVLEFSFRGPPPLAEKRIFPRRRDPDRTLEGIVRLTQSRWTIVLVGGGPRANWWITRAVRIPAGKI